MMRRAHLATAISIAAAIFVAGCSSQSGSDSAASSSAATAVTSLPLPTSPPPPSPVAVSASSAVASSAPASSAAVVSTNASIPTSTSASQPAGSDPILVLCDSFCDKLLGPPQAFDCETGCDNFVAQPIIKDLAAFAAVANKDPDFDAGNYPAVQSAAAAASTAVDDYTTCNETEDNCASNVASLVEATEAFGIAVQAAAVKADPKRRALSLPAKRPVSFSVSCKSSSVAYLTFAAAWKAEPKAEICEDYAKYGHVLTATQRKALTQAYGKASGLPELSSLFGLCGAAKNFYTTKIVSQSQLKEAEGMMTICPEHPQAAKIEGNIAKTAGQGDPNALAAQGKFAYTGKHLVPSEVKPGTWKSASLAGEDRVEDCYWETSDAQGEIIDNNYISVAPSVTVTIPVQAKGFTNEGCVFKWVGP